MANFIKIIFFLIVIVGIGVYLLSNPPDIFQRAPAEKILSSTPQYTAPPYNAPSLPSVAPLKIISSEAPEIPDHLIPAGFSRGQLSPYFQKVRISSAYASSYGSYPSQIQLYSSLSKEEKVGITGWRIKSNRREIIIPQAVNIYEPSGFAPQEDIILSANNYVNIYSNKSPINRNFRLNKCTGYLENTYDFYPSLPQNCPSIPRSEISHLSGQCQSYILSLWGCKVPDVSFYNSLPGTDEGNLCRQFLQTINFGSCFQKHRFDNDFLFNEWRVWVGENILDPQHDKVQLFDKQGLLVDQYTY